MKTKRRSARAAKAPLIGFRFNPRPGITLAALVELITVIKSESVQHFDFYMALPEPLQRHFRHIKHG